MATIKSYSDLQQSKKLAEVLPIESADMSYSFDFDSEIYEISTTSYKSWVVPKYAQPDDGFGQVIPCWSLAALLDVLPVIIRDPLNKNPLRLNIDKDGTDFNVWYVDLDSAMVEESFDVIKNNFVDACYEMILKLHELNLL